MNYIVYVLYSEAFDKIYVGYSTDLDKRMVFHNELGSGYTKRYRPWGVFHKEKYDTKSEALGREKALKSGQGRAWIWAKIREKYPKD